MAPRLEHQRPTEPVKLFHKMLTSLTLISAIKRRGATHNHANRHSRSVSINTFESRFHGFYAYYFFACCSKKEAPVGISGKAISYSLHRTRPVDSPRTTSYWYWLG